MKKLTLLFLALLSFNSRASTIIFQLSNWNLSGTNAITNTLRIAPCGEIVGGQGVETGLPIFLTVTNGYATNSFAAGNYNLTILYGAPYPFNILYFQSFSDTNTYNFTNVWLSGGNIFVTQPGPQGPVNTNAVQTNDNRGFTNSGAVLLTGGISDQTGTLPASTNIVTLRPTDTHSLFELMATDGTLVLGFNQTTGSITYGLGPAAVQTNSTAGFTNSGAVKLTGGLSDSTGAFPVATNEATVVQLVNLSNAIPAANLSGQVPNANLTNAALLNGASNTYNATSTQYFNSTTNSGNLGVAGTITGNGGGLTNLNVTGGFTKTTTSVVIINTNYVQIFGAGTAGANGIYCWTNGNVLTNLAFNGYYISNSGNVSFPVAIFNGSTYEYRTGVPANISDTTEFPYGSWNHGGGGGGSNPSPFGNYPSNTTYTVTNFYQTAVSLNTNGSGPTYFPTGVSGTVLNFGSNNSIAFPAQYGSTSYAASAIVGSTFCTDFGYGNTTVASQNITNYVASSGNFMGGCSLVQIFAQGNNGGAVGAETGIISNADGNCVSLGVINFTNFAFTGTIMSAVNNSWVDTPTQYHNDLEGQFQYAKVVGGVTAGSYVTNTGTNVVLLGDTNTINNGNEVYIFGSRFTSTGESGVTYIGLGGSNSLRLGGGSNAFTGTITGNSLIASNVTATTGFSSLATNDLTSQFTTTGITNTNNVLIQLVGMTGVSGTVGNTASGVSHSYGTITVPSDLTLQTNDYVAFTSGGTVVWVKKL